MAKSYIAYKELRQSIHTVVKVQFISMEQYDLVFLWWRGRGRLRPHCHGDADTEQR